MSFWKKLFQRWAQRSLQNALLSFGLLFYLVINARADECLTNFPLEGGVARGLINEEKSRAQFKNKRMNLNEVAAGSYDDFKMITAPKNTPPPPLKGGIHASSSLPSYSIKYTFTPQFLTTPHLWLTSSRTINASVSFETRSHWQAPLSGLEGTLRRCALLRFDFGVANNVTLQIRGAVQQQLEIDTARSHPLEGFPISGTTRDAGDFSVATIIRVLSNKKQNTALGLRIETKLPNSTQSKGIGPNTTDLYVSALASRKFSRGLVFGDLGLSILTAPRNLDEQNDVLSYGLGGSFSLSQRLQIAAEINGYLTTRNIIPLGTEARGVARAGLSCLIGSFNLEGAAVHGLTSNEGNWGGSVGLVRRFKF